MMIVLPIYRVKIKLLKNKRRNRNSGTWEGDLVELDLRVADQNNALRNLVDILLFNGAQEIHIVNEDLEKVSLDKRLKSPEGTDVVTS